MKFLKKDFKETLGIYTNNIEDCTTKNVVNFYNVKPSNYIKEDNKASILNKNKNYLQKI